MTDIKKGDRFEDVGDGRNTGRVVEVAKVIGLTPAAKAHIAGLSKDGTEGYAAHVANVTARRTYYYVRTEAHPKNPDAIGNVSRVSAYTLGKRYRKLSH